MTDGDDAASPEVSAIAEEGERVLCCFFFKRVHELSDFYHLPLVSRVISSPLDGERERERRSGFLNTFIKDVLSDFSHPFVGFKGF